MTWNSAGFRAATRVKTPRSPTCHRCRRNSTKPSTAATSSSAALSSSHSTEHHPLVGRCSRKTTGSRSCKKTHGRRKTARHSSGLADWFRDFFAFLANRCVEEERKRYLEAIATIQTGTITGQDVASTFSEDERQGAAPERLLPNVRLVNGAVKSETRQRLMLTFNSPFFPEVLIASSVMAEGVDLHRFCRYVIHHDLCWNPSTLEQRTGRVDRIGAKVERCGQPIRVYLPYLAETQDEKQYRVVMDRERWFSVVMGEKFKVDARTTDKLAQRIPLPASVAKELAFRLEVKF